MQPVLGSKHKPVLGSKIIERNCRLSIEIEICNAFLREDNPFTVHTQHFTYMIVLLLSLLLLNMGARN